MVQVACKSTTKRFHWHRHNIGFPRQTKKLEPHFMSPYYKLILGVKAHEKCRPQLALFKTIHAKIFQHSFFFSKTFATAKLQVTRIRNSKKKN